MMELIDTFMPLINKYYKLMNYSEDAKSDLILKLISLIKEEIDFNKMRKTTDDVLITYISTAISHHYILLSKNRKNIISMEMDCENDFVVDSSEVGNIFADFADDIAFIDLLKSILTKKELQCIYYTTILGYSSKEMGRHMKKLKQAYNQCKRRAFTKLKKYYRNNKE